MAQSFGNTAKFSLNLSIPAGFRHSQVYFTSETIGFCNFNVHGKIPDFPL
jgi:hypothetical protein